MIINSYQELIIPKLSFCLQGKIHLDISVPLYVIQFQAIQETLNHTLNCILKLRTFEGLRHGAYCKVT